MNPSITARRLKVTTMLDPAELLKVAAPDGQPRVVLRIALPDRTVKADLAAKSVRKAQATIREAGVENVALLLQGHLVAGDVIAEAGLAAQPKTSKPAPQAEQQTQHNGRRQHWTLGRQRRAAAKLETPGARGHRRGHRCSEHRRLHACAEALSAAVIGHW